MILSLVWLIRKYIFNIRIDGVTIVNWWYLILPDLYVNSSLVCILEGYDRFMSKNFVSWNFVNVLTSHTFISWRLRTFLRHVTSFLDSYESFTLNPFLSWWVQKFHVTYLYLLIVLDISLQNPFFLDNYECFPSNPCFLDGYEYFFVKEAPESTNGVFLPNIIIPLLFPSLLLTYKVRCVWLLSMINIQYIIQSISKWKYQKVYKYNVEIILLGLGIIYKK